MTIDHGNVYKLSRPCRFCRFDQRKNINDLYFADDPALLEVSIKLTEAATVVGLTINTKKIEYVAMNIEREVKLCDKTLTDVERGANLKKILNRSGFWDWGERDRNIRFYPVLN
jgi:hypothetical protein